MGIPEVVLANVLADALAHHEASTERSLVRDPEPDGTEHWLDFESAGRVCAAALELAGTGPDGRLWFTIPARVSAPPARAVGPVDGSESSAGPSSPASNLVGQVMGAAREILSPDAVRQSWLLREIRRFRPDGSLSDLQQLTEEQLGKIFERLEAERFVRSLGELGPGVHQPKEPSTC